jgi:L-threonylcarbamoyladenylate synthase
MDVIEQAVQAVTAGQAVVLPTDTVYGLCVTPLRPEPVARLDELKGRSGQPVALLAVTVAQVIAAIPELDGRFEQLLNELLPGPYTFVLPNPARRLPWLTPTGAPTIGVRIPALPAVAEAVVARAGPVAATSANAHGGRDPRRLAEVPKTMLRAAAAVLDGGDLPGIPSTVVDLSGSEPRVLRPGAGDLEAVLTACRGAR